MNFYRINMKNRLTIAAFLAAGLCSLACTKEKSDMTAGAESGNSLGEPVELTIGISRPALTKSTVITDDNEVTVNSLQVFVFRDDALDAYAAADNATAVTLSCTSGERAIYALVNAPDMSAISSKSALLETTSLLSNNSGDNFEMIGSKNTTLPQEASVTIDVNRIVSKIVVKKITRDFTSAALAAQNFSVDEIFIENVAGDINYGLTSEPAIWYNKQRYAGEEPDLTYDSVGTEIIDGGNYATEHRFYAYPNDSEDSADEIWAPRRTRLVLKTTLGDNVYYYPITLPELEPNKSYEIENITITRPGSANPDEPVTFEDCTFDINIQPWTVVPVTDGITI